ncbi:nuclease [Gryllotalpicola protaetiae]|uniref:Nuclease n=1 Tax=Gryllotalpicola protaetiae TaxID=2419771 RepID=A0A387BNF6_9MICO|nr:nuclease [Gryllotalpicola protaetiae]AYG03972.1 nuclease [Gryllotalpicola protaetiae]
MSRTISSTVLPIQRAMAGATPRAWRDGLVIEASGSGLGVAFLDGTTVRFDVFDAVELTVGEPVAYHPVAEILDAGKLATTARAV